MARYTGPQFKKSRRLGFSTLETGKEFAKGKKREYPPGQHGQKRIKFSDYGLHLAEKQKLKLIYGISERQFRNTFKNAEKQKGVTGTNFMQMLETRIDNVVYRMGLANTRRQARQLVNHNHITLNNKKADIPSMQVSVGDTIALKKKSQTNKQILEAIEAKPKAEWISFDKEKFEAKLDRIPKRDELNKKINEALVVEHYSK